MEHAQHLPFFAREVIFYAAQEAIRNAARHWRGTVTNRPLSLAVSMPDHSGVQVIIADDGVGRSRSAPNGETGSGLRFHSTTLAVIGGTLSVEDRSGWGTQVTIEVPES